MNTDLSAFYFDIRKDALYCEPDSSVKRSAALTTIEQIFRCTSSCGWRRSCRFTAEEAWLARYPGGELGAPRSFPRGAAAWRDDELAAKWEKIRDVRRVVTGALEIERAAKRIGSSLEAAPEVYVADEPILAALDGVDLAEVCITSRPSKLIAKPPPAGAFTLADVPGVGVVPKLAEGTQMRALLAHHQGCRRRPALSRSVARDAAAVTEFDAARAKDAV